MISVLLVRHGQASFGHENYDQLSPHGQKQALTLGAHLADKKQTIDHVYCGELQRQQQTWAFISKSLNPTHAPPPSVSLNPALNELNGQRLIQKHLPQLVMADSQLEELIMQTPNNTKAQEKVFKHVVNAWTDGKIESPAIGSWEAFCDKVMMGLNDIIKAHQDQETIMIVSSCGPISAIKNAVAKGDRNSAVANINWDLGNGSLSTLKWCPESQRLHMENYNDTGHLQHDNLATTL